MKKQLICLLVILLPLVSPSQNKKKIDSLKNVIRSKANDRQKVNAYNKIAAQFEQVDIDSCNFYADMGLELANKVDFKLGATIILRRLGEANSFFDNRDKAFDCYNRAMKVAEKVPSGQGEFMKAILSWDLAKTFNRIYDHRKALELLEKSESLILGIENDPVMVSDIKSVEEYISSEDSSIDFNQYLKLCEAGITNEYGLTYLSLNEPDSAILYIEKSIALCRDAGNREMEIFLSTNLADIYRERKEYDKALGYLLTCIDYAKSRNDSSIIFTNPLFESAEIYADQGRYAKAIETFREVLPFFEKIQDMPGMASCYGGLREAYRKKGDYRTALVCSDSFTNLNLRIQRKQADRNITELSKNAAAAAKISKARILVLEGKVGKLESCKATLERNIIISFILIIILLSVWLFAYLHRKKKSMESVN